MTINIGRMRDRISIEAIETSQDTSGGFTKSWGDKSGGTNVWADVREDSGSELVIGDKLESVVSHTVICRYISGINSAMRVRWNNNGHLILRIVSVTADYTKRFITLKCSEYETDNVENQKGG
jgi:SPP1 family predicted phage head-tail adaptor